MFPNWLNPLFDRIPTAPTTDDRPPAWGRETIDFRTGDRTDQEWTAAEIASLTSKLICHECNTGWMERLEGRSRPLLTPMILGNAHTLSPADQITVATWATKTVMVFEPSVSNDVVDHFPQDQRRIVMEHDRPPAPLRIRAAAIEGPMPPARFSCTRVQVSRNDVGLFKIHLYTLQMNTLVLQVIRPDPPPPNNTVFREVGVAANAEIPLFPPIDEFFWPPRDSFDQESIFRYIARQDAPPIGPPRSSGAE